LRIGLAFDNQWMVDRETLTGAEQTVTKALALRTLRDAFRGFDVTVAEGHIGDRLVVVDQGYVAAFGPRGQPAPVGETFALAVISRVHFEEIVATLLTVAGCRGIAGDCAKTRSELLEGLGRGIGASAAHELGHQMGLRFSVDAACNACYDGHTANTYEHFFADLHWSPAGRSIMQRVLPRQVSAP
jgi:hypothetical protein